MVRILIKRYGLNDNDWGASVARLESGRVLWEEATPTRLEHHRRLGILRGGTPPPAVRQFDELFPEGYVIEEEI